MNEPSTYTDRLPLLRQPLVQFLLLGALLFLLERVTHARAAAARSSATELVVPSGVLVRLREEYQRSLHRTPTSSEEADAVGSYVDEEVLFLEARAMRLDEGDPIVRRRLIQKAEFLLDDLEALPAPTNADLEAYLAAHAAQFRRPRAASFEHVLVARDRHGTRTDSDAAALLSRIRARGDGPLALSESDPFLAGNSFVLRTQRDIDGIFGVGFGEQILTRGPGVIDVPLSSAYGSHVVRVTETRPAALPSVDEVRPQLREAWSKEARERAHRDARERLRARYRVRVEATGVVASQGVP